jgi:hypothetical protein
MPFRKENEKMPRVEHQYVILVPAYRGAEHSSPSGFCATIGPFATREKAQSYLDQSEAANCHLLVVLTPVEGGGADDADLNP